MIPDIHTLHIALSNFYSTHRITKEELEEAYNNSGSDISVHDFAWHVFNQVIDGMDKAFYNNLIPAHHYYLRMRETYSNMRRFKSTYEYQIPLDYIKLENKFELLYEKSCQTLESEKPIAFTIVEILNSSRFNCCQNCESHAGKLFTLDEAILKNPLPILECTNSKGCNCFYYIHNLRRNKDGVFVDDQTYNIEPYSE